LGGEEEGGGMVYLLVIRVWDMLAMDFSGGGGVWEEEGNGEMGGELTVAGRAFKRRLDCVSHCWAVSRYGIVGE
tara:strand:+ start:68 stop:289 length:222 start_codon:yes stop_codon:yes gene_type:complete